MLKLVDRHNLNFTQNLKLKQNEIDDLINNFFIIKEERLRQKEREKDNFKNKLIKFAKFFHIRYLILSKQLPPPTSEFKIILQLTKELTNNNNSKLYFVYLPHYYRYQTSNDNTNYNLVKKIVTELKIPFIDIHEEVFKKEQNPLTFFPFELPGHYTVEGYKKVAETIYKFTKD